MALAGSGPSEQGRLLREDIAGLSDKLEELASGLDSLCSDLPNEIHPDVPEEQDRTLCEFNKDRRHVSSTNFHDHLAIMKEKGWMDWEEGVRVAGRGVAVLRNDAALLERVLCNYAIRFAISNGFSFVSVPDLIKEGHVEMAGFAPRTTENDPVFRLGSDQLALAGTAELPLLAMHAGTRHLPSELPKLLVAHGHAFRREAGQYGAAGRGLYRLHQFSKVELFAICHPEHSESLYEHLCKLQLKLIESLGFPGRVLEMCAPELGASASRKRDIELWFPHSQRYGEVTSASHCTDYQARRADIRLVEGGKGKKRFVHTLNATAVAVPRIIQCIAEFGCEVPAVLRKDMDYLKSW
jgi:seryl-tRNA synthetase